MTTDEKLTRLANIVRKMIDPYESLKGTWPNRKCKWCGGSDSGYYDSQDFRHYPDCPTQEIIELLDEGT